MWGERGGSIGYQSGKCKKKIQGEILWSKDVENFGAGGYRRDEDDGEERGKRRDAERREREER